MISKGLFLVTLATVLSCQSLWAGIWQVGPCGRSGQCPGAYTPLPTPTSVGTPNPYAPTNTPTATPTITRTPVAGSFSLKMNVGGGTYVDSLGNTWTADTIYSLGGFGMMPPYAGAKYGSNNAVYGSPESALYQSFRQGANSLHFKATLPTGTYQVIFKFADFSSWQAGQRVLTIMGQGATLTAGLDLRAVGNIEGAAYDFSADVGVTGTTLDVEVDSTQGFALLNAIDVRGLQALATATPTSTPTPTVSPTLTPNATPISFNLTLPPGAVQLY